MRFEVGVSARLAAGVAGELTTGVTEGLASGGAEPRNKDAFLPIEIQLILSKYSKSW